MTAAPKPDSGRVRSSPKDSPEARRWTVCKACLELWTPQMTPTTPHTFDNFQCTGELMFLYEASAIAAALDAAERERDEKEQQLSARERGCDEMATTIARLTGELEEAKEYHKSYIEEMHAEVNKRIKEVAALREVVEAAKAVNDYEHYRVSDVATHAQRIKRLDDALAALEEGK